MKFYLRRAVPIFLLLTAILLVLEFPSLLDQGEREVKTVYVQVRQGQDTYLLSFASDFPDPNLIVSSKTFPSTIRAETMWVSSDGQWLFAIGVPNSQVPFPLAYTHVGEPFTNPLLYDYRTILSADKHTLLYNSIDSSGLREAYIFLDLSSGKRIELVTTPLPNPGSLEGVREYIVPLSSWMPGDQNLTFTAYKDGIATGFYQIDLSGIDFTKPGQYPMPLPTQIMAFDRDVGGASFSPNKSYIAYFQADDKNQSVGYTEGRTVKLLNLHTGSVQAIPVENGEVIRNVQWRANGTLIYVAEGDRAISFRFYAYDPIWQRSQRIPLPLAGDFGDYGAGDTLICGNTLFYTVNAPENVRNIALYSARLDKPTNNQLLYVAHSIYLNSCATGSAWNAGKVAACVPFCTPTPSPAVGRTLDVRSVALDGGDAVNGETLYDYFQCEGCHQQSQISPPLTSVYTTALEERLADPLNADKTAAQYLAESVLQPEAYVVPSYYPQLHPKDYGDRMSLGELRDLVAYLKTLT